MFLHVGVCAFGACLLLHPLTHHRRPETGECFNLQQQIESFMKHFILDADPDLIPYFEELYEKGDYDFTLQYGIGDFYLLTTSQPHFYPQVLAQKGAREVPLANMADHFQNLQDTLWLGNESLVQRQL